MKKTVLTKSVLRVLPLGLFFTVMGLASCNSELYTGAETSSGFSEKEDSTENETRVNLVAKEELPDWLITFLDSMDEREAQFCAVYTAQWEGKQIYFIFNMFSSLYFWHVYNADGTPLIEDSDRLCKADWRLIYCVNQDEDMINLFLRSV